MAVWNLSFSIFQSFISGVFVFHFWGKTEGPARFIYLRSWSSIACKDLGNPPPIPSNWQLHKSQKKTKENIMDQINFIECTIKEYCPIIAFTRRPPSTINWTQNHFRNNNPKRTSALEFLMKFHAWIILIQKQNCKECKNKSNNFLLVLDTCLAVQVLIANHVANMGFMCR